MSEITIQDKVERFLDRKFRTSRSYGTKETYRGAIKKFGIFAYQDYNQDLGKLTDNILNKVLDPIDILDDFYTFLTKLENPITKKIGFSGATIRQYVTTAKEFLNDIGCNIYSEDVRRKIKLPRRVSTYTEGLTKEIIAQLLRLSNYRLSTLILLACSSGMRMGEILQLKLSDIDFTTNPVTIKIRAETTKTREARITHISREATKALKDYLAKSKPNIKNDEYVFLISYEEKLAILSRSKNPSRKLKNKIEKKLKGLNSEEKLHFRYRVTKHNFENQLRRVIDNIPELNKRTESGRKHIHFHAFRYFFKTQVTDAHESDYAEALMGHKSLKLVYYRQNEKKRQKTYHDVEHALTISETEKIDENFSELQKNNLELREIVENLSRQLRDIEKRIN